MVLRMDSQCETLEPGVLVSRSGIRRLMTTKEGAAYNPPINIKTVFFTDLRHSPEEDSSKRNGLLFD